MHARSAPLAAALLVAASLAACSDDQDAPVDAPTLKAGVLVSLTGTWSTLGRTSVSALQAAAADANAELGVTEPGAKVTLRIIDTKLEPDLALDGLRTLAAEGVKVVIGPQSSSEVRALKAFADSAGIVLISQGSTAGSLAIANDFVYRFVPNDSLEAEALVALLQRDGITVLVPLWRDDAGNQGLHDAVEKAFTRAGGTMLAGVMYGPDVTDFTPALAALKPQLATAATQAGGTAKAAVYYAAFNENVDVFELASADPAFSALKWYGSDGTALSAFLPASATASGFAHQVGYWNPTFGISAALEAEWSGLAAEIEAATGIMPGPFAFAAYDALRVAARAWRRAGYSTAGTALRDAVPVEAAAYSGATGATMLDAAGDRATAGFDFWVVCPVNGGWEWTKSFTYLSGTIGGTAGCTP